VRHRNRTKKSLWRHWNIIFLFMTGSGNRGLSLRLVWNKYSSCGKREIIRCINTRNTVQWAVLLPFREWQYFISHDIKISKYYLYQINVLLPIPVAERSLACVCGLSLAGIVDSNPAGALMSVSCACCVLSGGSLWVGQITRPEESYRVSCVSVWSWILYNEAH